MLDLKSVMVGTTQLEVMAHFYEKVFARPADMVDEGNEFGWKLGSSYLILGHHSEMKGATREPGRLMYNFETRQLQEEFERIKATGAKVVAEPYEMAGLWIATFADPDGNYFQLMTPFEEIMGL
jgi:predicted enzyme related to lactoylglutathione lyase